MSRSTSDIGWLEAIVFVVVLVVAVGTVRLAVNHDKSPFVSLDTTKPPLSWVADSVDFSNANGCGLPDVAFCETFDTPAGIGNRTGELNGMLWGVSRATANQNIPVPANGWAAATVDDCGNTSTVTPPHDVVICNGQLHDSVNDAGSTTTLAMYPKQPFDFTGRTGKIVFDVSNDSEGNHSSWPELWFTDRPVPAPFTHDKGWTAYPRNGFGIRFSGCTSSTGQNAGCPRAILQPVGVNSAIVIHDYVGDDSATDGKLLVKGLGAVTESQPGQMNHYEIDVSQNQIDVYATNAFSGPLDLSKTPLVHIASIPNIHLNITKGLVWLEDVHYNANRVSAQQDHTFAWDNFGFDGPVLPRDLAFDVPDNTTPDSNVDGLGLSGQDLGYVVPANSSRTLTVPNVSGVSKAAAGLLVFDFYDQGPEPFPITYAINGHQYSEPWPFPWKNPGSIKTLDVPVKLADVHPGNNTVTFSAANTNMSVFNIDLVMVGADGIVKP